MSKVSTQALADRAAWLEVIRLSPDRLELNPTERERRTLKGDHRGRVAPP
ncbi:MAG TPA: hypothetical protein VGR16_01605 [Thermomicrobiales bacterium]|nr:hypothetical protein [Thermomicrobiales bacterium]